MKKFKQLTFTEKIKWRIRILWLVVITMLVYMIVVAEMGGGDSRIMTDLAKNVSRIIYFGGLGYVIYRIIQNKKLHKNRKQLKEQLQAELDERNQYLHDKSGGIVMDILLICLLFITWTTSMFDMGAFYTALVILALAIVLKAVAYFALSNNV